MPRAKTIIKYISDYDGITTIFTIDLKARKMLITITIIDEPPSFELVWLDELCYMTGNNHTIYIYGKSGRYSQIENIDNNTISDILTLLFTEKG